MCGIVGYVGAAAGDADPPRRPEAARVPRLRLGGRRGRRETTASSAWRGARASSATSTARLAGDPLPGPLRRRPHALGDARPPLRGERPPAPRRLGPRRRHPQRHHRELPAAEAASSRREGVALPLGDRHGGRRAGARRGEPRARPESPSPRSSARRRDAPGDVRARPLLGGRAGRPLRGQVGAADRPRAGRGRELRRVRRHGPPPAHARPHLPRGRRPRPRDGDRHHGDGLRRRARAARPVRRVPWDAVSAEKGGYPHFMAKEIAEQPTVVVETVGNKLSLETGRLQRGRDGGPARAPRRGRADPHRRLRHELARGARREVPPRGDRADSRPRSTTPRSSATASPIVGPETLVVGISQSGETADTVAALQEAKRLGARTVGVVNVPGSAIARMVDGVLATHAGPEIGVASTKAFTTQLVALALFAHYVGRARGGTPLARRPVPDGPRPPPGGDGEALALEPAHREARASASSRPATSSSSAAARTTRSRSRGR